MAVQGDSEDSAEVVLAEAGSEVLVAEALAEAVPEEAGNPAECFQISFSQYFRLTDTISEMVPILYFGPQRPRPEVTIKWLPELFIYP